MDSISILDLHPSPPQLLLIATIYTIPSSNKKYSLVSTYPFLFTCL